MDVLFPALAFAVVALIQGRLALPASS